MAGATYRERRLARATQLRGQAGRNQARSDAAATRADNLTDGIPMGQPILVGHYSEGPHRRVLARADAAMRTSIDTARLAGQQAARADGIEAAAERAIYDDDPDAVERLTAKLARLATQRDAMKAANAAYRREHRAELKAMTAYNRDQAVPYPAYAIANIGGVISATRKRLEALSRPEQPRLMVANWPGECRRCGGPVVVGQQIHWYRRARAAEHASHTGPAGAP